jgi:hypothetical protein
MPSASPQPGHQCQCKCHGHDHDHDGWGWNWGRDNHDHDGDQNGSDHHDGDRDRDCDHHGFDHDRDCDHHDCDHHDCDRDRDCDHRDCDHHDCDHDRDCDHRDCDHGRDCDHHDDDCDCSQGGTIGSQPTATPSPAPSATPAPTPTAAIAAFNPATAGTYQCRSYVEIYPQGGQQLAIPARDAKGTCYYVKLIGAAYYQPSSSNGQLDSEIVSRNHDVPNYTANDLRHPYLLGNATLGISMEGARSLVLSGGADSSSSILVDNFILVGLAPASQAGNPAFYKAYGTSDSTVQNSGAIAFKQTPVYLTPFATGGTSTIAPLPIDGSMQTNQSYQLDVRALDCGIVGRSSDIYLVVQ